MSYFNPAIRTLVCLCIVVSYFLYGQLSHAKLGVGVGIGKIQVDKPMRAGQIYTLPSLPVINTGDQDTAYEVSVEFHEGITQRWPEREWFIFNPQSFTLAPGEVKNVDIQLKLPLKTQPGDYFSYLEAHPVKNSEAGVTAIGIAAAAKLYFTIEPANIFQAITTRISDLFSLYTPWSYIGLSLIAFIILILVIRKNFSFNFGISIKKRTNEK